MKNKVINNKIVRLWTKYFNGNTDVHAPIFYNEFTKDSLLFVGCNPSFSLSGFTQILRGTEYENIKPESFFKWNNIVKNLSNIDKCTSIEKYAFEKYKFFTPLKNIATNVNLPFEHIDLFLYKKTNQESFKKLILENGNLNKFGKDQLNIFKIALNSVNPKIVVVANAFTSGIILKELKDYISNFDKKKGFNWFSLDSGIKIPIFFSSMLSGQRALDVYSRERLEWHIKQAIIN